MGDIKHQKRYNEYHKHTSYSNLLVKDSVAKPEDYMKRAVELGHTTYFTTEHGYQGNIYEAQTLCEKYGLKPIFAVEAYYADDMYDKTSRVNHHIVLVAMNAEGQREIKKIISKAYTEGFYYKPRIDLKCLLSLTPENVVVTTACVTSRMFKGDDWEEKFLIPVSQHFKDHFFLEVQNHNDPIQIEYNKKILEVKRKYGLPLIHANDSHYIYPEDAKYRTLYQRAKKNKDVMEDNSFEDDFILDYPDSETIFERYTEQGVLTEEEVNEALDNTLIFDKAEPIHIDKEFKLPKIKGKVLEYVKQAVNNADIDYSDPNEILKKIIAIEWKKKKCKVKKSRLKDYKDAIQYEYNIIKKCDMAIYFIIDYIIVKRAVKVYNGVLTHSGRGSAVSFYLNNLLGFTKVDRIKAPVTLYPTRFMSAERILLSRSLPDIDLNWADVEPVIQASKDILGEDNIYYMVSYKPMQEKEAFRTWCRGSGYDINEYDEVAKDLESYVDRAKNKNGDTKWLPVIEESKRFIGVVDTVSPSACSFLLLDKPISEEIGLLRVGDPEKNEYIICCALDGYNCDYYKYLKNDYLTVAVYKIIDRVYKLIGRPIDDISTLINNCDDKVWSLYEKGLTKTINQADTNFAKGLVMEYKPKSLAELSAFVAALRPGFASLRDNFIKRKPYTTGVKDLDDLLEDSFHYLMYQESIMKFLVWLGVEEKDTYDIIKKISKKKFKQEELDALEKRLEKEWVNQVGTIEGFSQTWQVVQDAAHYSFNASHSFSVAIDSLYGAYLKSHYPLEYYTVTLDYYKDDTETSGNLVQEMSYFGLTLKPIKFGKSSDSYTPDRETNSIYKSVSSVKNCNKKIAEQLFELSRNQYDNFIKLLDDITKYTSVNTKQLKILTSLNYFSQFGKNKKLLKIEELYYGVKVKKKGSKSSTVTELSSLRTCSNIKKANIEKYEKYGLTEYLLKKYSAKETEKTYKGINNIGLLRELAERIPDESLMLNEQIKIEKEMLGYVEFVNPQINKEYYIVTEYKTYSNAAKPYITLYNLSTGKEIRTKIKQARVYMQNPFGEYSILKIEGFTYDYKSVKVGENQYRKSDEKEMILDNYEVIKL